MPSRRPGPRPSSPGSPGVRPGKGKPGGRSGKGAKGRKGRRADRTPGAAAPLHDRRRRLVAAREVTLRDLGGLMLEMYKRNRFREELLLDKCEEVLAIEVEVAHVDQRLFQLAPPNAAGMRPIGRCECGAPVHPGQNFCATCGRAFGTLTQARNCARCATALRPGDQFCARCGADAPDVLQAIAAPPPPTSGAPAGSGDTGRLARTAVEQTVIIDAEAMSTPPLDAPSADAASARADESGEIVVPPVDDAGTDVAAGETFAWTPARSAPSAATPVIAGPDGAAVPSQPDADEERMADVAAVADADGDAGDQAGTSMDARRVARATDVADAAIRAALAAPELPGKLPPADSRADLSMARPGPFAAVPLTTNTPPAPPVDESSSDPSGDDAGGASPQHVPPHRDEAADRRRRMKAAKALAKRRARDARKGKGDG